jgi:hypothetical protein
MSRAPVPGRQGDHRPGGDHVEVGLRKTAAWPSGLGKGLQSPVPGFDSRRRLYQLPIYNGSSRMVFGLSETDRQ